MKTRFDTLENKNYLLLALIGVVVIFLVGNIAHQEEFPIAKDLYMTDLLYMIFPGIVVVFGLMLVFRYRLRGSHGISWILFTLAITSWYVGDMTYKYDYKYDLEDLSTLTSDFFYIIGYTLFLGFTIFYLKPRKRIISKKMVLASSLVSVLVVIATICFIIADTAYLVFSIDDTYYPGHPIDILFVWAYILYAFGALSHVRL